MIYEVSDLKFSYGSNRVLDRVNLTLNDGELLCVLGRNGSGKSTLFSCLLGLLKPEEGSIKLCGKALKDMKEKEIASFAGFVPQNVTSSFGFSVFEYVLTGFASSMGLFDHPSNENKKAVIDTLKMMGIESLQDRVITELSGGERQIAAIARALVSNPKLILFDEPTAHLDYNNQIKVLRVIKDLSLKGYAIGITTHDPNHAILLGGSVALLDGNGNLKTGSAEEMLTEEKLKALYGDDLKIRYLDEFKRNVCIYPQI